MSNAIEITAAEQKKLASVSVIADKAHVFCDRNIGGGAPASAQFQRIAGNQELTMGLWALACAALAAALVVYSQGPPEDEIIFLPGLAEQPNFKHYSGFLNAGATRKMFYWFVASQGTPEKDPLLLWLDAGPGCSAMVSMFKEHGPFRVADGGKSLVANAYSWNKLANVLYLEAPASVGFSYDLAGNYTSNDDSTVDDIQGALADFFDKFGSLKANDFYLSGKGSAATYVAMLASRLLKDPKGLNLKAFPPPLFHTLDRKKKRPFIYFHFGNPLHKISI
ncbi:lysosomal protective protein-like [Dermacentor variabilis]|uniref:lysosomal protective protein-like n=1 Tax=Dermacentor variabilis TaxID=34621 RepID=UPI003F5C4153